MAFKEVYRDAPGLAPDVTILPYPAVQDVFNPPEMRTVWFPLNSQAGDYEATALSGRNDTSRRPRGTTGGEATRRRDESRNDTSASDCGFFAKLFGQCDKADIGDIEGKAVDQKFVIGSIVVLAGLFFAFKKWGPK